MVLVYMKNQSLPEVSGLDVVAEIKHWGLMARYGRQLRRIDRVL